MRDDQTNVGPNSATPAGRRPGSARGTAFQVAALLLTALCLMAGAACWLRGPRDGGATDKEPPPPPPGNERGLFHGWPKPDFVLVLSAQQHGYLLPCGCSSPQYGGLERRYNFVESLKARGWPVVAYDLGDIPQKEGPAHLANVQGLIKYRYSMEALKKTGYAAVSFGEFEAAQPLKGAIDEYALNSDKPAVLSANLLDKAKHFPDADRKGKEWDGSYVGSWHVTQATPGVKVGAVGITGTHDPVAKLPPSVAAQITAADRGFAFERADKAIPAAVAALAAAKPDFRVLLYQGPVELAKLLAQTFPQFNVILCLSAEDEPPALPEVVGNTFIVRLGHKGKNVGVVGVYAPNKPGQPFAMRYQLVLLGEEYKTPEGKEKGHPILDLMESYTKELKRDNYLARYGKVPHATQAAVKAMPALAAAKAGYASSQACKQCHPHAWNVWDKSDHAKAYQTLVNAKRPSLREHDAECIVCHTVGFRYDDGFADAAATPKLKDVGCESCHGPCDIHKKNPNNKALYALINPWKAPPGETAPQKAKRQLRVESMCRECHDGDNDVKWNFAKWAKVEHMTPAGGE